MINLKNEKGSITVFVLASCLFFIGAVACTQIYMQSKQTALEREYRQIKSNYETDANNIDDIYDSSATSYLDGEKIVFEGNENANDYEDILTTNTSFDIILKNNDGTNYDLVPINYEMTIVDNDKFAFVEGDKITETIKGSILEDNKVTLNLKIKDLTNPKKFVRIKVNITSPYKKSVEFNFDVEQKGAIQTIEDLVDLSLASRGIKTDKYSQNEALTGRFKMTRDLDFQNSDSYEDSTRIDYGNVNLDEYTGNLMEEMTKNAGFLPIGEHSSQTRFNGVFNGGGHTLDNLLIHSVYSSNSGSVGLFEDTGNATIKDLKLTGNVTTTNYANIGTIAGRNYGDLTVENVVSNVKVTNQNGKNGSTGGIIGSISEGKATVKKCKNYGEVSWGNQAAGLIGWIQGDAVIENSHNYGNITIGTDVDVNDGFRAGGLVGSGGTINNYHVLIRESSNHGDVLSIHSSGGIIGMSNTSNDYSAIFEFVNTYNTGRVTGWYAGGITGRVANPGTTSIINCANLGEVNSNNDLYASGIIGNINNTQGQIILKNVYNAGILNGAQEYGITKFDADNKSNVSFENVYWLSSQVESNLNGEKGKYTQDNMKTSQFVSLLNSYVSENPTVSINGNQYNLFSWEINEYEYPTLKLYD